MLLRPNELQALIVRDSVELTEEEMRKLEESYKPVEAETETPLITKSKSKENSSDSEEK